MGVSDIAEIASTRGIRPLERQFHPVPRHPHINVEIDIHGLPSRRPPHRANHHLAGRRLWKWRCRQRNPGAGGVGNGRIGHDLELRGSHLVWDRHDSSGRSLPMVHAFVSPAATLPQCRGIPWLARDDLPAVTFSCLPLRPLQRFPQVQIQGGRPAQPRVEGRIPLPPFQQADGRLIEIRSLGQLPGGQPGFYTGSDSSQACVMAI